MTIIQCLSEFICLKLRTGCDPVIERVAYLINNRRSIFPDSLTAIDINVKKYPLLYWDFPPSKHTRSESITAFLNAVCHQQH
ncbi:Uncharacterised protein [Salmonella enterica subsp. arizonae]|uniref:Uncharacterized protein n=1 Tax=Salmonella enterica subsp. arizonae TaxID=59203 RepID=A0A379SMD7_SALER|nr:Uncharacterised protein [Salmonella enterica subsp. arizonae]